MSLESDLMERALQSREGSGFGGQFTYGDANGPCSVGKRGFGGRLVSGGISPGQEIIITIRKSIIDPDPTFTDGDLVGVNFNGETFALKIAASGIEDCGYAWELTLNDANQNA